MRQGYPSGHSLAEVYYDGDWHELDSDESIISLLRDNETIASEAQIVADHDLLKRTHTYGPLANDNRLGDESGAALLFWEGERTGEQPSLTKHNMNFTLRPGESITWAWNPANLYHAMPFSFGGGDADAWNKQWRVIAHVMDGEMIYSPDLSKASTLDYLKIEGVERKTGEFGSGLYLIGSAGTVDVPVSSAYAVVGGRLDVDFARLNLDAEEVAISISFDEGKSWNAVQTSFASDYSRMYVDLNPFFKKTDPARYEYILRFTLRSRTKGPAVALKGFYLRSTLQMAPLAMPGVVLGENNFTYTDDGTGARSVKITHNWNECDARIELPAAPAALAPGGGKPYSGTRVKFQWGAGTAPIADYEFELSEFADMRWTLSSNFHKLISRTAERGTTSYTLPSAGLLNPGQTYYWRVRGRSEAGVWGEWSKTVSFSADAPAVPIGVRASFDRDRRAARLAWRPGKGGTKVVRYRIYGSEERGFSANDKSYEYNGGLEGTRETPGNLLLETQGPVESVDLPEDLWRPYYRVVAVDNEQRVSGASAIGELPHPLITSRELPVAIRMRLYEARIKASASIGHLVSADENGQQYQMKFRGGDEYSFSLAGAPEGFSIDDTGLISGFVTGAAKDRYELTVNVKSKTGGTGDFVKLLLQIRGK